MGIALLRMIIFLTVLVGGIGFILYQLMKFSIFINNPASLAKRDGGKLRTILAPYLDRLVPLTAGEMELFSLNKEVKKIRKSGSVISTGVFNSIYHEPLMAYAHKQYRRNDVSTLLARTLNDEFFYVSMKGETRVFHNGKALGLIKSDGRMFSPDQRQLLATIAPEDVLKLHPVTIGDREVGNVLNPKYIESPNPRAFQFLEKMNERERVQFLSLSILSIVEETLI